MKLTFVSSTQAPGAIPDFERLIEWGLPSLTLKTIYFPLAKRLDATELVAAL